MGTSYISFIPDRVYNLLQRIQTGYSAINLSAGVVRDNDAINSPTSRSASEAASEIDSDIHLDSLLRILHALDPFQAKWPSTANHLPLFHRPPHPFPGVRSTVPDVLVDPLCTRCLRILLRVYTDFCQPLQENWILEAQIPSTMFMVESIVPSEDVVVSPAERPSIRCNHANIKAGLEGSLEHGNADCIVVTLIELEEPRATSIGLPYILDTVASSRRERIY